jgi:phenylacetate-CoA ligase
LKFLKSVEYKPPAELTQLQEEKLERLFKHAYDKVPYYNKILSQARVIKNKAVNLANFHRIPVLTKAIIRREGESLYSKDYQKRGWYLNTSGGSTGEPVKFIQDRNYRAWAYACRFYYNLMAGKDAGEEELKLWGSEQDILEGAERTSTRLRRWGFNVILLNSFAMSDSVMSQYVKRWNSFKPKMVWAYTSSIYEFAEYIKRSGSRICNPASIVCTAETLTEDVRNFVEEVLGCPVLNQYGSREVGVGACECLRKEGLHTFPLHNKIELLDQNLDHCAPGKMGGIYVTTLNNYSMPLIRYQIGDTAVVSEKEGCSCGRGWPLIAALTGRTSDHFRTKDGKLVHGEYFTHLFYNKSEIRRFRVVQHDYDDIEILIEPANKVSRETLVDIEKKTKLVLGEQCDITFSITEQIPRSPSGKYRYTISEVS